MLNITCEFLKDLGLSISVDYNVPSKSKTKCVAFGTKLIPTSVKLNGVNLPWSDNFNHLGHLIYKNGSFDCDVESKRKSFCGQFHALRQELGFQSPVVLIKLINVYLLSLYGSNLWDIFNCEKLFTTWNNIVRNIFELPLCTHRYLIEPLSEFKHIFTLLVNRFINFYNILKQSDKLIVNNLRIIQENDMRSTFGRNLHNICSNAKVNSSNIYLAKNVIKYNEISEDNIWRVSILKELIDFKKSNLNSFFEKAQISQMIIDVACY